MLILRSGRFLAVCIALAVISACNAGFYGLFSDVTPVRQALLTPAIFSGICFVVCGLTALHLLSESLSWFGGTTGSETIGKNDAVSSAAWAVPALAALSTMVLSLVLFGHSPELSRDALRILEILGWIAVVTPIFGIVILGYEEKMKPKRHAVLDLLIICFLGLYNSPVVLIYLGRPWWEVLCLIGVQILLIPFIVLQKEERSEWTKKPPAEPAPPSNKNAAKKKSKKKR